MRIDIRLTRDEVAAIFSQGTDLPRTQAILRDLLGSLLTDEIDRLVDNMDD